MKVNRLKVSWLKVSWLKVNRLKVNRLKVNRLNAIAFGCATRIARLRDARPSRSTFNLGLWPRDRLWLRYAHRSIAGRASIAFNLQPWPIGHATRTTFNFIQPSTLFNLQLYSTFNFIQPSI
ncbi:MAG: hypothetical protein F6K26_02020 [Moorea sp. SIO2I5]|nr:hypothetical protein [Moorena sp. SIO2I5]